MQNVHGNPTFWISFKIRLHPDNKSCYNLTYIILSIIVKMVCIYYNAINTSNHIIQCVDCIYCRHQNKHKTVISLRYREKKNYSRSLHGWLRWPLFITYSSLSFLSSSPSCFFTSTPSSSASSNYLLTLPAPSIGLRKLTSGTFIVLRLIAKSTK